MKNGEIHEYLTMKIRGILQRYKWHISVSLVSFREKKKNCFWGEIIKINNFAEQVYFPNGKSFIREMKNIERYMTDCAEYLTMNMRGMF